jgi:catechol 2,3-dioxygenase-like lactoylglutathione lyase family enzyme
MPDMACRFTELIIDCRDPRRVADFWASALGYEAIEHHGGGEDGERYVELRGPEGSGPSLVFLRVPEPKTLKNRLHIDVNATDGDQAEEVERLLALGARRVDIGQGEQSWVVLADPEGNEFCVLRSRVAAHR